MSVDRAGVIEPHAVILVEGMSDQAALEALAGRRGQALDADGISIAAMGVPPWTTSTAAGPSAA